MKNNERYNQIINDAYMNYCDSFKSSPVEPHPKKLFIDKCKHNIAYSERWGLTIEERRLSREERYDLMPSITGHHPQNIAMRKIINNFEGNIPGVSYHEEWLDSFHIPKRLITVTYNNETIESYE